MPVNTLETLFSDILVNMWLSAAEQVIDADGFRPTQSAFLRALAETGSITRACDITGIDRTTPYGWLDAERKLGIDVDGESPEITSFAYACQQAKKQAAETVLGRVHEQAMSDDKSMPTAIQRMFVVKRWMPEYRDQLNVKHSGAVLQARVDLNQLDPTERADLLRLTQRRLQLLEGGENVAVGDDEDA